MEIIHFLRELITEDTPILELKKDPTITLQQKYSVLGFSHEFYPYYMYYQNFEWYYFKQEEKNDEIKYPYYLLDELMGSYLAQFIGLSTISFQIAKRDSFVGLASKNFREKECDYYFFDQLPIAQLLEFSTSFINIEMFKSSCIDNINVDKLVDCIFKLLALDLYMLQMDRSRVNLQFQINRDTIYDFSNCADKWQYSTSFNIFNPIITLTYNNIPILCKKYPQFLECLSMLVTKTMSSTWNQICEDYHFNQDCFAYFKAKEHYQLKDENQKKLLRDIQARKISI